MRNLLTLAAMLAFASCTTPLVALPDEESERIRVGIADIESKENLGGPA